MKKLLCCIAHLPSFEATFAVLERLHQRGKIEVVLRVRKRLIQTEPRVKAVLEQSGMNYRAVSVLGLEIGSLAHLKRVDAVLAHTDPYANRKRSRLRDTVIPALSVPHIFLQHGMFQYYLNYPWQDEVYDYYSQKLLVWDELPDNIDSFVQNNIRARSSVVGFLKKNPLGEFSRHAEIARHMSGYEKRILICHNFGWEHSFSETDQETTLGFLSKVIAANPNTIFIMRPHRGRRPDGRETIDDIITRKFDNTILSDRHSGLFKFTTIHDVICHCSAVITHPSTVVLDAAYSNKPVGIIGFNPEALHENARKIEHLPMITDALSMQGFLDQPCQESHAELAQLKLRYGSDLDRNLDTAAAAIESFL